jgi:hypothetical protein
MFGITFLKHRELMLDNAIKHKTDYENFVKSLYFNTMGCNSNVKYDTYTTE